MRILMPSIVDPAEVRGGAWTVTRGLIAAIRLAWPRCVIECMSLKALGPTRHAIRQGVSVAASITFGGLPAKMRFTRTGSMQRSVLSAIAASPPDLILINGSDLMWLIDELPPGIPVAVVAHNLEQDLYSRRIAALGKLRPLASLLLANDFRRLGAREARGLEQAEAVIFLSEEDRREAGKYVRTPRVAVLPPVFDYEPRARAPRKEGRLSLGMFADFRWWPNRVSLDWFLEAVWPSVGDRCHLHLMGSGSDTLSSGIRNTTSHGFISDPRDAFAMCDLMIAPIIDGAGIKVKVAEAMYNGVPIVATPFALRGLPSEPVSSVKVCDGRDEWIAFLSSGDAWLLADETVTPATAGMFSVSSVAPIIQELLGGMTNGPEYREQAGRETL